MTTTTATLPSTSSVVEQTAKPIKLMGGTYNGVDSVTLEFQQWNGSGGIEQCYRFLDTNCYTSGEKCSKIYHLTKQNSLVCHEMSGWTVDIHDPSGATKYEEILEVLQGIFGKEFMEKLPKNTHPLARPR